MAWKDLTLSDRARMMQLAVKSGITDLRTIQEVYNKFDKGGEILQNKNLLKYINELNSYAIKHPEWFWGDSQDAQEARAFLYNNGAEDLISDIYNNTPENIQATINRRKLPNKIKSEQYKTGISEAIDNGGRTMTKVLAATAAVPLAAEAIPLAAGVISNISANSTLWGKAIYDTATSMLGGTAADLTSETITGRTVGENVANAVGADNLYNNSAIARFGFDALNPGYGIGDGLGRAATSPTVINSSGKIIDSISKISKQTTKSIRRFRDLYRYGKNKQKIDTRFWHTDVNGERLNDTYAHWKALDDYDYILNNLKERYTKEFPLLSENNIEEYAKASLNLKAPSPEAVDLYRKVDNQTARLMDDFPEFAEYLAQTKKNPLLQSTIDDFIERQRTSIRGVSYTERNTVDKMLSEIKENAKRTGGDRLGTNGGLYTSNSAEISDKFSRPQYGVANGAVGILKAPIKVDKTLPFREQLLQARQGVFNYDDILRGFKSISGHFPSYSDISRGAKKAGFTYGEAQYTTRIGDVLPVNERVFLNKDKPVEISSKFVFPEAKNIRGRWALSGVSTRPEDSRLFIPFQTSEVDLPSVRTLLKNLTKKEVNEAKANSGLSTYQNQARKLTDIANKSFATKLGEYHTDILFAGGVSLPVIGLGIGATAATKDTRQHQKELNKYWDNKYGRGWLPRHEDGSVNVAEHLRLLRETEQELNQSKHSLGGHLLGDGKEKVSPYLYQSYYQTPKYYGPLNSETIEAAEKEIQTPTSPKAYKEANEILSTFNKDSTFLDYDKNFPYYEYTVRKDADDFETKQQIDEKYSIPFIEDKKIKLTKAEPLTGTELSTNMLDSIYKYAVETNLPIEEGLGIAGSETAFGKFPSTAFLTPSQIRERDAANKADNRSTSEFIRNGKVNPTDLVNFHRFYSNSYNDAIGKVARVLGNDGEFIHDASNGFINANIDRLALNWYADTIDNLFKMGYRYADKKYKTPKDESPLKTAFEFYKAHPESWNAGDPATNIRIKNLGNILIQSPEISSWLKTKGKEN